MLNEALSCLPDTTRSARCDKQFCRLVGEHLQFTGVFRLVRVAAVGLQAAACLGVVGATDGCTMGAVGACCSCTASEVDGVVIGCPATSTLGCMSGLTASG